MAKTRKIKPILPSGPVRVRNTEDGGTEVSFPVSAKTAKEILDAAKRGVAGDKASADRCKELEALIKAEKKKKTAKRHRRLQKAVSVKFKEADIVVTDPCYLIPDRDAWLGLCRILEQSSDPQKAPAKYGNMIMANTIFGDWFCRMMNFDGERTEEIDTFTADSGTVCVAALTKESEKAVKSTMPECYTIIRGFTGVARIAHVRGECLVTLKGTCKHGRINAWSVQEG